VDTFAQSQYVVSATKAGTAATNADLQNAENAMTSLTITAFNQLLLKPLVSYGKTTAPF